MKKSTFVERAGDIQVGDKVRRFGDAFRHEYTVIAIEHRLDLTKRRGIMVTTGGDTLVHVATYSGRETTMQSFSLRPAFDPWDNHDAKIHGQRQHSRAAVRHVTEAWQRRQLAERWAEEDSARRILIKLAELATDLRNGGKPYAAEKEEWKIERACRQRGWVPADFINQPTA
jgi:hypothetical protein